MEQGLILAINALAFVLDGLATLIERYPLFGQALPFAPVILPLWQRSVGGVAIGIVLSFCALIAFLGKGPTAGLSLWAATWIICLWFALKSRRRRRMKALISREPNGNSPSI